MNIQRNFALKDAKVDLASAAIPQRRQEATRRGFLKSAVAFGGLVATSRLPVFADDVSLFRGRGMFERLSLIKAHIDRTSSPKASRILADWANARALFAKVQPVADACGQ